jgi:DNA-binding HxlR family transcriptional regulator
MKNPRRGTRAKRGSSTGGREHVLELFVDEWAIALLQTLDRSPKLYSEMRRELRPASQAALAQTLSNLQNAGLVWRKAYPTSAARVEYSLTALGKSFIAPLTAVCDWADRHELELSAASIRRGKQVVRRKSESSRSKR